MSKTTLVLIAGFIAGCGAAVVAPLIIPPAHAQKIVGQSLVDRAVGIALDLFDDGAARFAHSRFCVARPAEFFESRQALHPLAHNLAIRPIAAPGGRRASAGRKPKSVNGAIISKKMQTQKTRPESQV